MGTLGDAGVDATDPLWRRGDFIWGSWVRSAQVDGWIAGLNPGDRADDLGRTPFRLVSVDHAVGAAVEAKVRWASHAIEERLGVARVVAERLEEEADALAVLIARESGKPVWEASEEVRSAIRACRLLAREGAARMQPRIVRQGVAWSVPRPRGVVGLLTPSVSSLLMPVLHVVAAIVAGNTVVWKPSKFATGVGQALAVVIDRCRLPRGVFNLVQGSGATVGQRLAGHPGLDALLFLGRHETAAAVNRATAPRPELAVGYQCGGKSASFVLPDADLDRAAYDLSVGAFATTGQRHDNTARIFVERRILDAFLSRFVARTQALTVGYGLDRGVFLGPLVSDAQRVRFRRAVDAGVVAGHRSAMEEGPVEVPGRRGFYVRPVVHVVEGGGALDDEPVGPIVRVYPVDGVDEAVRLHEKLAWRLATSIHADREGVSALELAGRLTAGTVYVNRGPIGASFRLPGVGLGRASNGMSGDLDLLRFLTIPRAMHVDTQPFDATRWVPGTGRIGDAEEPTLEVGYEGPEAWAPPPDVVSSPAVSVGDSAAGK